MLWLDSLLTDLERITGETGQPPRDRPPHGEPRAPERRASP
ncbi:hypothetical protein [Streptomyces sp. NPDC031705]